MATQSEMRRKVLEALYRCHTAEAFCPVKTRGLIETLGIEDEQEFFDALQYLHDEDYIQGIFVAYERQGEFENVRITKKGVDTMGMPDELDKAFPVGSANEKVEQFVRDFRREVDSADLANEEKERLHEFIITPAVSEILSRLLPEKK
jgi:hypothetical protein